jgi:hypothetical protein
MRYSTIRQGARRAWKSVDKVAGIVSGCAFASAALLWMYYGVTLPTVADPDIGRTWGLNHRGKVVYLTQDQFVLLMVLFGISLAGLIAVVLIEAIIDPYDRRRRS